MIRSLGIDTLMVEDPYENYEMPSRIIDYSVFGKFVERVQRVMETISIIRISRCANLK